MNNAACGPAQWREYLLSKPQATLDYPFGPDVEVFKVANKMFALLVRHNDRLMLNLKCDPVEAAALCDIYAAITPGYHMDKRHWISVYPEFEIARSEVIRLIDNSYALVVAKLPKKTQATLVAGE
ncbi:MmcQ/YjbR family DNA-binding protein [Alteromonas flava]|uniref:MmcQ/YjbR family DNA-binding protein n=1 Tax=Alteromonas flava TaxID=2048003 RepID=UPI000C292151|nr:MmcQ/YjbR family DNA-binding protein [Alteromonas flava]